MQERFLFFIRDKQIDIHQAYYHIIRQLLFVQKVIHLKDVTLQPNKIINNIQTSNKEMITIKIYYYK